MPQRLPTLWTALVMLVMIVAQFSGLEHLCLCGSCAVSKVLTGAEPEHACCAKLRQAPGWHDEGHCGCGDHNQRAVDAELAPDHDNSTLAAPNLAVAPSLPLAVAMGPSHLQPLVFRARAPPQPRTRTYLLTLSMLM